MRIILSIVFIASLFSCTYNKGELIPDYKLNAVDSCTQNISYANDIQQIFTNKCATSGCHNGTRPEIFTNYSGIIDQLDTVTPANSRIKIRINDALDPMPPAGSQTLTSCELSKLNSWINAKAPNN